MRSALRRMGNSTGLIVPKPVLEAAGLGPGAALEVTLEEGRIIAAPVATLVRAGWREAAREVAAAPESADESADERAWRGFGLDTDEDLAW
ncbi:MAG TPA: hypothetical protein VGS12_16210 [Caulobacteraceae bacterium]|nr:hypothetical protein [Caulobacteraceae bacterium]